MTSGFDRDWVRTIIKSHVPSLSRIIKTRSRLSVFYALSLSDRFGRTLGNGSGGKRAARQQHSILPSGRLRLQKSILLPRRKLEKQKQPGTRPGSRQQGRSSGS
jgi:hypothetical protein